MFWGGSGYPALWNEAPFLNNQDLFIIKDDYTKVFGKHFVKAGVLASFNKKNEDTDGNGASQHSRFWGSAGLDGWGSNTGNILADFLLRDMAFGFSEASAGRSAPQRWRDTEMYVADSWQVSRRFTFDYGVRYSLLYNPYTTDDKITSFVPSLYNPALGNDSCNGLIQPPGSNWCQSAGARGGVDGPNRSLMDQDFNNIAPRLGFAWDVKGDGKTAVRGGIGQFYPARAAHPRPQHCDQSTVCVDAQRHPEAGLDRGAVRGLLRHRPRCPDTRSRSRDEDPVQLAVESDLSAGALQRARRSKSATSRTTATTC